MSVSLLFPMYYRRAGERAGRNWRGLPNGTVRKTPASFNCGTYNSSRKAVVCALIIAVITFVICMAGLITGKKFGTKFADKASIFGGVILIMIGIEIFVTGIF